MMEKILLKYGEIALKGANKSSFEATLAKHIRIRMKKYGDFEVTRAQSTVTVTPKNEDCDIDGAYDACKKIFGIVGVSRAVTCEKNIDSIIETLKACAPDMLAGCKTFKIEAKRADKRFPLTSPQICDECGGAVLETVKGIKVDVRHPDEIIRVEIRDDEAFIHPDQEKGAGGMPVGTNGRALLLLSGGIDSPVAGHMICKRGVKIEALHFESYPYTSERALEKVAKLAELVSEYNGYTTLHVINVKEIQEVLRDKCDEDYFTLLLRRFMMRLAQRCAEEFKCSALVTGESIGQVASQTMDALCVTDSVVSMPVFRPCIGLDKEEIVEISRKINTYETSVLPYEDCCTVFTPRHPRTRPEMAKVIAQEERIDVEGLLERAYETMYTYRREE
ncbi:MAG: tRNA 4-thiouridine(8) synthase ThiI [Clostridia bacterium]|nr:tRNA 4-thiouridine(8) synthase ThiI [Clostridia bacterium]